MIWGWRSAGVAEGGIGEGDAVGGGAVEVGVGGGGEGVKGGVEVGVKVVVEKFLRRGRLPSLPCK